MPLPPSQEAPSKLNYSTKYNLLLTSIYTTSTDLPNLTHLPCQMLHRSSSFVLGVHIIITSSLAWREASNAMLWNNNTFYTNISSETYIHTYIHIFGIFVGLRYSFLFVYIRNIRGSQIFLPIRMHS